MTKQLDLSKPALRIDKLQAALGVKVSQCLTYACSDLSIVQTHSLSRRIAEVV